MDGTSADGFIVRIDIVRGFGFVRSSASKDDFFFHHSAIAGGRRVFETLSPGQAVRFVPSNTVKGQRAEGITLLDFDSDEAV